MATIGTAFIALGLGIALVIIILSLGQKAVNDVSGGTSGSRRNFLNTVVALGVSSILAAYVGGEAMDALNQKDRTGQSGTLTVTGTHTVTGTQTVSS